MHTSAQIFEIFGYPVDSWSAEANSNLRNCQCPFMCAECDGGGNRFSSNVSLTGKHPLREIFPGRDSVPAGVCSLQLHPGEQPWIVCPRRLLNYRNGADSGHQKEIKQMLCEKSGLVQGTRYSVWSEVKMKCNVKDGVNTGIFDYTLDYVITGRGRRPLADICGELGYPERKLAGILTKSGFTICSRDDQIYCDDFPTAPLVIVEVMTSSTCGGNKKSRTQIAQIFEDTILKLKGTKVDPGGPCINYRQVWARMVSQLLVKSQIGKMWGGTTFWVLQDLLAKYISDTTALNFSDFLAEHSDEVNIVTGGYGDEIVPENRHGDLVAIRDVKFYSGKVGSSVSESKTFSDIIKLGCTPPKIELTKRLIKKSPCASFVF